MIVSFKLYVMNFVNFVFDCYSHITSYVSQVFTSCTHYTSYSLLNFVYIIVCVFGLTNQVWKFLEFYAKHIWCLREWIENLNFGKTRFKTCVFEKHFISYSCMWFIKFNVLRSFCIILLCFSKNWFFQNFDRSNLFFNQLELHLKCLWVSICFDRCSIGVESIEAFSINRICFSINQKSCKEFFQNCSSCVQTHFFKSFSTFSLSIRLDQGSNPNFCCFPPFFLQGFPLLRPIRPLYPSFCFYFHFSYIKSCIIWEISNLWYFGCFWWIKLFSFTIDQWLFVRGCYKHDLWWLIWSIWCLVRNWKF